jgi:hypothetical protein
MKEHNVLHEIRTFLKIDNYHVNILNQEKLAKGEGRYNEL